VAFKIEPEEKTGGVTMRKDQFDLTQGLASYLPRGHNLSALGRRPVVMIADISRTAQSLD